ncbi:MAG TPA: phosphoribosyltransferase family protein [Gammaproteobacteria bacterium]|nr:phosphoribosyltransferase family protein [Gammaproteobacteria bacterium]HRA42115.1 phosphoribosyltransferase family protein [Gammaproteobacteria bacterium]
MKKYLILLAVLYSGLCFGADKLQLVVPPEVIAKKLHQTATLLNKAYQGEPVTVLMVMKGAICLTADLIRKLDGPVTLEYVKANTYGEEHGSKSEVKLSGMENLKFKGKNILIVDDVMDSGNTMAAIIKAIKPKKPKSLKTVVLLSKKEPKKGRYSSDYALFCMTPLTRNFPDDNKQRNIVGYGIDFNEHYRELPGLYIQEEK